MITQTILESIKLIYVDVNGNNNKVWQATLRTDGLLVQWGRVGAKLQEKFHVGASYSKFDQLKREKLAKGYTPAQTIEAGAVVSAPVNLKQIALEQIQCDDVSRRLLEYLTEVNIHNIVANTTMTYQGNGVFTTPLGAVTADAIAQARRLLNQLAVSSGDRSRLLNDYLRLIPQDLGRISNSLFQSQRELQQQHDLLDALASVVPAVEVKEQVFNCTVSVVPYTTEAGRETFRQIKRRYEETKSSGHVSARFKLKRVYELAIPEMATRFEKALGNVQQLWHGTKASNLLSILKNGLIIPPASATQCTGRMFGNGVYFSTQSTKSLNYATNFWNQSGSSNQQVFMLLTDVALGKEYRPTTYQTSFGGLTAAPRGCDSLWIEPGTCSVMNHEAIVYRTSQVNLRYLCEFE